MTEPNQHNLSKALELANSAKAERALGNGPLADDFARQALQLAGMTDERSYVETIESRVFTSANCRVELEMLLDIQTTALSLEHPAVRNTLERLTLRWGSWFSDYYGLLGTIYQRLIILRINQAGPEESEIADRFMNYAEYLASSGRNLEAQNCLTRAVTIRKAALGKYPSASLSYAQALTRLGCLLVSMSNYEVAEGQLKTALDLLDKTKSILKLHALEDLGTVYIETGRREQAESILKQALSQDGSGASNSVANCAVQLGGIYLHWGRIPDAFTLFDFSITFDRTNTWTLPALDGIQTISDELTASSNPYLEIFEAMHNRYSASDSRRFSRSSLVRKYSWAIPNEKALETIISYGPLMEIGAGTGYWAALLRQRGADVICYESQLTETGRNSYVFKGHSWTEVLPGTESAAAYHPDRSLMLCWPPEKDEMAYQALKSYRGQTLIYVGEEPPGCTADEKFHDLVRSEWHLQKRIDLPRWHLLQDSLYVYSRK